jgi:hypothetical protein
VFLLTYIFKEIYTAISNCEVLITLIADRTVRAKPNHLVT